MKKFIANSLVILLISSCQTNRDSQETNAKPHIQIIDSLVKPYSNPNFIYGSTFGAFFQTLYKQNQFELMYRFTSQRTIEQFDKTELIKFYKERFKFDFLLGKLSNTYTTGDTITLTYANSLVFATKRKLMINVTIENDSVKLILDKTNINKHGFFFSE